MNGRRIGRVDLAAPTWRRGLVYLPSARATWTGTVVIRSTTGANSRIDAVAILR